MFSPMLFLFLVLSTESPPLPPMAHSEAPATPNWRVLRREKMADISRRSHYYSAQRQVAYERQLAAEARARREAYKAWLSTQDVTLGKPFVFYPGNGSGTRVKFCNRVRK